MEPTAILSNEHRVIEVVLDCLEQIAGRALETGKLERESADQALDFFRTFADGCHHGKEEKHLFPAMVAKGVPEQGGPVGVMLAEHDQGRGYIRTMNDQIEAAADGDTGAIDEFNEAAQAYIAMLRAHIMKEDQILFPLADRIMSEDDERSLMAAYEKVEHHHMGEGTHERYVELAATLAKKFGVDASALHDTHAGGGCGRHHAQKD